MPQPINNKSNSQVRSHHTQDPAFGISKKELARLSGEAVFWPLALVLILAPLLHGSGTVFTQGPLILLVVFSALCWVLRLILVYEARAVFSLVGGPVVVLATYVVVRYTLAEVESVSRPDMMLALMAALIFFLLLNNVRHRWQMTFLTVLWISLGTLEALYGFLQIVTGELPTGTFVATADFTLYLQITLSVAAAKFLFSRHELRYKIVFAFCALVMAVVILLSGPRTLWTGLIASLGVITVYLVKRRGWRFRWAATGLCVFFVVMAVGAIGIYSLRRQETSVTVEEPSTQSQSASSIHQNAWQVPPLWKSAIAIGQHNLVLGGGPGMFRWLFSTHRHVQGQPPTLGNVYLSVFAEYGMIGFFLLIWLIISFFISIAQILKLRAERYSAATLSNRYAMALASFTGVIAVLVDAGFDFNPRMAGNLLTLAALIATGLTCGVQHHGKSDEVTYHPGKHSTLRLTGVSRGVIIAALVVFVLLLGSRLVKSYPACWLLRFGRQQHAKLNWSGATARYRQAWALDRRSFEATRALGDLYCARATWNVNQRPAYGAEAIQWYDRALVLNPYANDVLISMGRLYDLTGQRQQALSSYQRAVQADPNNASYYVALGLHHQRWGEPGRVTECFNTARELTATYGVFP